MDILGGDYQERVQGKATVYHYPLSQVIGCWVLRCYDTLACRQSREWIFCAGQELSIVMVDEPSRMEKTCTSSVIRDRSNSGT